MPNVCVQRTIPGAVRSHRLTHMWSAVVAGALAGASSTSCPAQVLCELVEGEAWTPTITPSSLRNIFTNCQNPCCFGHMSQPGWQQWGSPQLKVVASARQALADGRGRSCGHRGSRERRAVMGPWFLGCPCHTGTVT